MTTCPDCPIKSDEYCAKCRSSAPSIDAVSGLVEELRALSAYPGDAYDRAADALEAQAREQTKLVRNLDQTEQLLAEAHARIAALESDDREKDEALRAVVNEETISVHVGYDHGPGGGNYVYADAIRTDSDAFRRARSALSKGEPQ